MALGSLLSLVLFAAAPTVAAAPDAAGGGAGCPADGGHVAAARLGPAGAGADDGGDEDQTLEQLANMQLLQQGLHVQPRGGLGLAVATAVRERHRQGDPWSEWWSGTTGTTTPDPTGVKMNASGDLLAFLSALGSNGGACVWMLGVFCILRLYFPLIYSNNVLEGNTPAKPDSGLFGWIWASLRLTTDEVIEHVGLDQAMLLEFTHLAMKVLAIIGTPMLCVCGPLNWAFGGNAAGDDRLSYLSFGNVRDGSPLYWMYAFVVWGVVFTVQTSIYKAQRMFLVKRFAWLRAMAPERANTVLVEGIPEAYRSDRKLFDFFEDVLPGDDNVHRAYIVKDTSSLMPKAEALKAAKRALHEAGALWDGRGRDPEARPTIRTTSIPLAPRVDSISYWTQQVAELEPQVLAERDRLEKQADSEVGGINLSAGFVTFGRRVEAELALRLDGISQDSQEWRISNPPAPQDVQWDDLTQDPRAETSRAVIGYLLVAALYFAYMPCVLYITNLAKVMNMGFLQPLWQGLAPTMGLQFMVAFLPTFLILIFKFFFTLKAAQWAQQKLQNWYFWFQLFFVVLATAVGQNVPGFTTALFKAPIEVFDVLARTMPYATHFYMNYLVLQWLTHCMNLTRYVQLGKFLLFKRIYAEEEARSLSEPEDQDYYGMGSRSSRWTINLIIGIVYGTLSPPINLLAFVNFAICRLVYGYLLTFAETRKTDLGGAFWVSQLRHLFVGNIIYCILMTGVLFRRAASSGPMLIAAPSILYVLGSMGRFETAFNWTNLPFQELWHDPGAATKKRTLPCRYVQPELEGTSLADASLGSPRKKANEA